ncbi:penicillin-binding protein 2 [Candidatus Falkowbacteria bacterium RIFOXYC2_FULL_47_12]|uniref:Penicillin-binding protein 2 n=2 Tax=Candidatus Falkowiibacteriota TaxID=1752728 RepID=A0A1F5TMR6_9BACT|nr:MAG: penicillin-binding protein 2 [Candidatus Falkowbacteria bacterium RIFOXYA2_FULL_47_9]OGF40069.1 MAG: penicillin-binding protein 2 [Candidatus Falkowbacteria bacterium RIFOXYC2_FULL_47_12]
MIRSYQKKFNKDANPFRIREGGIADAKLSAGYRLRWTEEGILGQREAEAPGDKVGRNISAHKLFWLAFFLVGGFALLFGKTAYLQTRQGGYYEGLANANRIRERVIAADRGVVYDQRRQILAYNTPVFYLQIIPADVAHYSDKEHLQDVIKIIGETLGGTVEQDIDYVLVRNETKTLESYQPQIIADDIEHDAALRLQLLFEGIPGLSIEVQSRRHYVLPALSLAHVLGYTGTITQAEHDALGTSYSLNDTLGKTGLEKQWETELRGVNGKRYVEVNALGQAERVISLQPSRDGYDLTLSLDAGLQQEMETELRAELATLHLKRAAAIALDPRNGDILALVSLPSFDSNDFSGGIDPAIYQKLITDENQPLFNRAIAGSFAVGSAFKPIVAAAALQEGVITPNTTLNSAGGIRVNEWFFPDWKAGGHGITNVRSALAWSVNTFFYTIGGGYQDFSGLGVQKITDYARLFGLGASLGIDLPNEASGFLPSKDWKEQAKGERWYIGDTYNISIGQGDIIATPLQVAAYTAFFANGGTLYRPHVVRELLNSNGSSARVITPEVIRHDFIDSQNISTVRAGMRDCVTYGSCRALSAISIPVAGKTGTAQWSSVKDTHAWFTGFAPYDDPQIVITVLIEEGGEGSAAAVPVAKRVLEWYFSRQ